MRKISSTVRALAVLACLVSCQQENGLFSKGEEISVRLEGSALTKSESVTSEEEELLFSVPVVTSFGDTLSVEVCISDMPEEYAPSCPTKGTPVTTGNIGTVYGSFTTTVFKDASKYTDVKNGKQMDGVTASYAEGKWTLADGPYHWPLDGSDIVFCSSAPVSGSGVSGISWNGGTEVSFSYENTPSGVDDAKGQKDILFAINKQNRYSHDSEAVINFSHALVGVKFIKGDIEKCTVKSVSLKQFKSSGKSVGTPIADKPNSLSFTWSDQSTLKDYTQAFGTAVDDIEDKGSLDPTGNDESCTFLMIPQELDENAGVEISLQYGESSPQTVSVNLGSITAEGAGTDNNAAKLRDWSGYAGKVITIRVNRIGIDVDVDETFDGAVKNDVGVKNTGGKIEFVRAAIVANWVDDRGYVHGSCDFTSEGTLEDYLETGCNWTLHTDGFYYYSKAINPGAVTEGKIFTGYTAPSAPDESLHLEMVVIAQGVEYDPECAKAKAAWGLSSGILTSEVEK